MSESGDWYCRNCGYITSARVTHSETCDQCHIPVEWHDAEQQDELTTLRARVQELEAAMREIYEVYAGSDGFIAETAAEGYQQRLIEQMTAIARDHLPTPPEDSSDE